MIDQLPPGTIPVATTLVAAILAYFGGKKKEAKRKIVEFETEFRELLREQGIFPSPDVKRRNREFVDESLKEEIEAYDGSDVPIKVYRSDGEYFLPATKDDMEEARVFNPYQYLPYRPERFDCEDYASAYAVFASFLFGTNGVGVMYDYTADHAYNVIVYSDGSIEVYEPQTGEVIDPESDEDYSLQSGLLVI